MCTRVLSSQFELLHSALTHTAPVRFNLRRRRTSVGGRRRFGWISGRSGSTGSWRWQARCEGRGEGVGCGARASVGPCERWLAFLLVLERTKRRCVVLPFEPSASDLCGIKRKTCYWESREGAYLYAHASCMLQCMRVCECCMHVAVHARMGMVHAVAVHARMRMVHACCSACACAHGACVLQCMHACAWCMRVAVHAHMRMVHACCSACACAHGACVLQCMHACAWCMRVAVHARMRMVHACCAGPAHATIDPSPVGLA
eukprot:363689-Chlamydomonas_euryale.AAC.6